MSGAGDAPPLAQQRWPHLQAVFVCNPHSVAGIPCAECNLQQGKVLATALADAPAACASAAFAARSGFRGVSAEQDSRFANKEKKLIKVRIVAGPAGRQPCLPACACHKLLAAPPPAEHEVPGRVLHQGGPDPRKLGGHEAMDRQAHHGAAGRAGGRGAHCLRVRAAGGEEGDGARRCTRLRSACRSIGLCPGGQALPLATCPLTARFRCLPQSVDPRQLQISLTGFLEKNTSLFCRELWQLLVSANQTGTGIPQRFLDEKAEELRRQKEEQERVQVGRGAPVERLRCGLLKGLLGG